MRIDLTPELIKEATATGEAMHASHRKGGKNHRQAVRLSDVEIHVRGAIGEVGVRELFVREGFDVKLTKVDLSGRPDRGVDLLIEGIRFGLKTCEPGGNLLLAPAGQAHRGSTVTLLAWSDHETYVELAGWATTDDLERVAVPGWGGMTPGTRVVRHGDLSTDFDDLLGKLSARRAQRNPLALGIGKSLDSTSGNP